MTQLTFDVVRRRLAARPLRRATAPGLAEAAVAVILAPGPGAGLGVLFIHRAERSDDPWSGHMAFPGGRRDPGDADLLHTAVRETAEETGIVLAADALLGEVDDVHPQTPALPPIMIRPYVFGLASVPAVGASPEVQGHIWVPLGELRAAATREEINIRGAPRAVRGYRLGPHLVWGLTERIVTPLLALLREND